MNCGWMGVSTQLPAGSAAAARRVTGSCRDFTLDGVKFRVVCRGNLEIGLESDTQDRFVGNRSLLVKSASLHKKCFYGNNNLSPIHPSNYSSIICLFRLLNTTSVLSGN